MRDPARVARERLLRQERQAKARAEAQAVAHGVAETVALSRARGAAIAQPQAGARTKAYKRLSGLDWLASKGRINPPAKAAGERYGAAYRRARLDPSIASTLEAKPGATRGFTPDLEGVLTHGEGTAAASRRLAALRARLSRQADLVAACDLVCGEEMTPREAARGDRDATRLEAVLKVALDLLAG